jgi:hypothetical protein
LSGAGTLEATSAGFIKTRGRSRSRSTAEPKSVGGNHLKHAFQFGQGYKTTL